MRQLLRLIPNRNEKRRDDPCFEQKMKCPSTAFTSSYFLLSRPTMKLNAHEASTSAFRNHSMRVHSSAFSIGCNLQHTYSESDIELFDLIRSTSVSWTELTGEVLLLRNHIIRNLVSQWISGLPRQEYQTKTSLSFLSFQLVVHSLYQLAKVNYSWAHFTLLLFLLCVPVRYEFCSFDSLYYKPSAMYPKASASIHWFR